jgi:quinol-cytochrome oxidoreductase complex cytochrome b subunit
MLTFYYVPDTEKAFESVRYLMREVNHDWLIRYSHANAAFFFFAVF